MDRIAIFYLLMACKENVLTEEKAEHEDEVIINILVYFLSTFESFPAVPSSNGNRKFITIYEAHRRMTIRRLHHIIPKVSKTTIHEAVTEIFANCTNFSLNFMKKLVTDQR
jgi:hypothetical protein